MHVPESSTVSSVSLCQRHVMAAPPSVAMVATERTVAQLDTAPTPVPAVLVGCEPKSSRSFDPDDEKRADWTAGRTLPQRAPHLGLECAQSYEYHFWLVVSSAQRSVMGFSGLLGPQLV